MFGPLPLLHRVTLALIALAFSVVAGAWIARFTVVPFLPATGACLGLVAGLGLTWVLLHQHQHAHLPRR